MAGLADASSAYAHQVRKDWNEFETWQDLDRWQPASFPDGDGVWTWAEPDAQVSVRDGQLRMSVDRFTRRHDHVQIFDNPKHLLACADPIPVPDEGLVVDVEMAGATTWHGPPSTDWRDGFASFNLMDLEHGLVLDGLANGRRSAALWERLHIPGIIPAEQAWTTIAEGPASAPGRRHRFRFSYDPAEARIQASIDDRPVLEVLNVPTRIRQFTPAFGLITVRPIQNGRSTSVRGQGAQGRLGAIRTTTLR